MISLFIILLYTRRYYYTVKRNIVRYYCFFLSLCPPKDSTTYVSIVLHACIGFCAFEYDSRSFGYTIIFYGWIVVFVGVCATIIFAYYVNNVCRSEDRRQAKPGDVFNKVIMSWGTHDKKGELFTKNTTRTSPGFCVKFRSERRAPQTQ